jgi:hypothetical protein
MKNERGDNFSLCSFLLTYRVSGHAKTGVSPAECMLKSKPKTLLDLMKPDPRSRVRQQQEMMESGNTVVREFQPGDQVWVQCYSKKDAKWSLGVTVRPVGPLSYDVLRCPSW